MDYEIITDACSNMTSADITDGLTILNFPYIINGQERISGADLTDTEKKEFYTELRSKAATQTSQINTSCFNDMFSMLGAQGKGGIYIGLSSGISGTFRQAELAAEDVGKIYPEPGFYTVDSKNAGFAETILVKAALSNRDAGMSISDNAKALRELVSHVRGEFMVDDLAHLRRTGRIPAIVMLAGAMLGFKPLLHGNDDGIISMIGKARGKHAALDMLAAQLNEHIMPEKQRVYISHCDAYEDAMYLAGKIKNNPSVGSILVRLHEPMSACHLGPGAVALFYLADKR